MDRISKPAVLSQMSHKKCQYGRKVKQMLVVLIRPLQYLCLILSGCCLLDICFDLPGQDVRHQVRAVVAWWQESDNDSRILSFRQ
ncbi:TPA: hypothetical protein PC598_001565 [Morganella morganii]|uniref:hypothetical protein n=1 Tax=Morganella morganii TaxID=582 RepID=UPI00046AA240|nr:hypothetical protein [Morganella morganii]HDF2342001.1 hypothetical protein [Morganella morganii]